MLPSLPMTCEDYPDTDLPSHAGHRPIRKRAKHRLIRKRIYTLNVPPPGQEQYSPRICHLTYPLLQNYAEKIGAEFHVITKRKFPKWPVVYEKLQIHELGKGTDAPEWNIYIDSDTLVSPEFFDVTNHLPKDTVCHNGRDMAGVRWRYDEYFRRDGRHWGSCNWFTVGSEWCLDLWRPLDDLTPEQAFDRIHITLEEHGSGQCKREHLIDDFTLSRNIARFGLKATTVLDICGHLGWRGENGAGANPFLYHLYNINEEEKLRRMLSVLASPKGKLLQDPRDPQARPIGIGWGIMAPERAIELMRDWGL